MLAKEEMPFTKYPAIELEKRHGVSTRQYVYGTEHKCQEFTNTFGDCLQDDMLDEIRASRFVTVSLDGSTDSSVQEKEMIYVTFITADGHPKCKFFSFYPMFLMPHPLESRHC